MELKHILLRLIDQLGEATGYECMLELRSPFNYSHQQIYRILNAMEEDGLIHIDLEPQKGKPDKRICSLTEKGTTHLASITPNLNMATDFSKTRICKNLLFVGIGNGLDTETAKQYVEYMLEAEKTFLEGLNHGS